MRGGIVMNSLFMPILLLILSLFIYMDEIMEESPNILRAAVCVLALIIASIDLTLVDAAG
jgi:hypothetical protein